MSKVIGLKLIEKDKELIKQIEASGLSNSELLRKALNHYFEAVNHTVNRDYKEKNTEEVNQVNQMVNHSQQEKHGKPVNQLVNHKIQVTENYELLQYLRRDHEWLQNRIEHFEHTQDTILAKIDTKHLDKDKSSVSWVRM